MLLVLVPQSRRGLAVSRDLMGGFGMEVGSALRLPPTRAALLATMALRSGRPVRFWDETASGPAPLRDPTGKLWEEILVELALPTLESDLERVARLNCEPARVIFWSGLVRNSPAQVLARVPGARGIVDEEEAVWKGYLEASSPQPQPGAGFARWNGTALERGAPVAPLRDLGCLPIPERRLLRNQAYRLPDSPAPVATMTTSRGCPLKCAFCGYAHNEGRRLRLRPLEQVLAEWGEIAGLGIRRVVFRDPLFSARRAHTLALVRALEAAATGIRWQCESAPRCLDEELIAAMARAGCEHVSLGIESASARIQAEFCSGKLPDPAAAGATIRQLRAHGIRSRAFFMLGFPGESRAEMRASARLARALRPDSVQFCALTPYPGTALGAGLELGDQRAWDGRHAGAGNGSLEAAQIDFEIRRAYCLFYLHPPRLLRELAHPRRFAARLRRAWSLLRPAR